jgi:hypothetical protein
MPMPTDRTDALELVAKRSLTVGAAVPRTHRPHRALNQAAPLRPLPDGVTGLDPLWVQRRHRAGGGNHEYRLAA